MINFLRPATVARCGHDWRALALAMRRLRRAGRLALLDGGNSRRTTVMRLYPSGQPAYISVIRRRRRLILRCPSPASGSVCKSEDPIRQKFRLTVGPSISAMREIHPPTAHRDGAGVGTKPADQGRAHHWPRRDRRMVRSTRSRRPFDWRRAARAPGLQRETRAVLVVADVVKPSSPPLSR